MNSIYTAAKTYRATNLYFLHLLRANKHTDAAIKIPNRIPRGPTDILKALESTVSYDTTSAGFKYHDDPFLTPYNSASVKTFSLAKSAGQKAARWIRDQHPELFTQVISEPPVMSYMPAPPINADTVNEQMLLQKISERKVSDAIKVCEFMQEKSMEISQDTQLELLELLCYFNGENPTPVEDQADRFHGVGKQRKDSNINTWQNHSVIKYLFESLKHLGSAPYSAMICGLITYGAKSDADELLKEAREKGIILDVSAYNALILRKISQYEEAAEKVQGYLDILKEMQSLGVQPNIGTLNAVMDGLSRLYFKGKTKVMLQLMADFNSIGVKPSIGTFGLMMRGLLPNKARSPDPSVRVLLMSLLQSLEGQELEIRHSADVHFFDWFMKACVLLDDLPCAIKCLDLFLFSKNRQILDAMKRRHFFNNFLKVLSLTADFETLIKYYNMLVPLTHTPDPEFYEMLFDACDVNGAIKEVPVFWEHYMGSLALQDETLLKMLQVAVNTSSLPDPATNDVKPVLSDLAEKLLSFKIQQAQAKIFEKVPLTSEMINLLAVLLARGPKWRGVQMALRHLEEKHMEPEEKVVLEILNQCYEYNNPNMAVWVVKYCITTFGSHEYLKNEAIKMFASEFLSKELKNDLRQVVDYESSSSSSSSSSGSESSDSDDSSDSDEDLSIPKKEKQRVPKPEIKTTF